MQATNADIGTMALALSTPWRPYSCRYARDASPVTVAQDFIDAEQKHPARVSLATLTSFLRAGE